MSSEREKEVLFDALELPAAERRRFVAEACRGDRSLQERVEALLAAHAQFEEVGLTPVTPVSLPPSRLDLGPGDRVGGFVIREFVGEGGFGRVFRADQEHPVQRQVALKVVKSGMDSRAVIARFEAERQALAIMNHPNIARVFDAGTTDGNRPYFVMEFIDGVPITEYCEARGLGVRERLDLLRTTCFALQHAHEKGIIHRDIKPTNVLVKTVDGRPVPMVIDFGIAKATGGQPADPALATREGLLMGTPVYMSPEQAAGSPDIDTRTDVYALGVVLYELLAGAPPISAARLASVGPLEMQRILQEETPPPPSAFRRGADASATRSQRIAPELDWITLKCLEKDRARRYASPLELAADLDRYFDDQPVHATAPSAAYRARKFVRRHRLSVAVALVLVLGSLIAFGGVVVGLVRARRAEAETRLEAQRANREARTAGYVAEFLVGLFEVADPGEARGNTITAREILDRGALRVAEDTGEEPLVRARLMRTIGRVYGHLGLYADGAALLRQSLALLEREHGSEHADVARGADLLAQVLEAQGEYEEAEALYRRTLATRLALHGRLHADVVSSLNNLAGALRRTGDLAEAERLYRESLEIETELGATDPSERASTLGNLSLLLSDLDRLEEAEELLREALDVKRRHLGDDHPDVGTLTNNLGLLLFHRRDFEGSERALREALAIQRKVLGAAHPDIANTMSNLATVLKVQGDFDGAERLYAESLEINRAELGDSHAQVGVTLSNLAGLMVERGDLETAELAFGEAIDVLRAALGPDHWMVFQARCHRGACWMELGRFEEAEPELSEALAGLQAALGPDHQRSVEALVRLADLYDARGDPERAAELRARLPSAAE